MSGKIATLHSRIAKERKILEGFQALRAATTNADVIRTCEAKMRESNKTIGWFEDSLREFEDRRNNSFDATRPPGMGSQAVERDPRMRNLPLPPPGASPSYQQQIYQNERQPDGRPGSNNTAGAVVKQPKIVYTNLGAFASRSDVVTTP